MYFVSTDPPIYFFSKKVLGRQFMDKSSFWGSRYPKMTFLTYFAFQVVFMGIRDSNQGVMVIQAVLDAV